MGKTILQVFYVLTLAGCVTTTARMERMPGTASGRAYAPINEGQTPGVVSYRMGTSDAFNAERRDDAYKNMYTACGGRYRITKEYDDTSGYTVDPETTFTPATVVRHRRHYIEYLCVEADGGTAPGTNRDANGTLHIGAP